MNKRYDGKTLVIKPSSNLYMRAMLKFSFLMFARNEVITNNLNIQYSIIAFMFKCELLITTITNNVLHYDLDS